jgi:hypothetical protein
MSLSNRSSFDQFELLIFSVINSASEAIHIQYKTLKMHFQNNQEIAISEQSYLFNESLDHFYFVIGKSL